MAVWVTTLNKEAIDEALNMRRFRSYENSIGQQYTYGSPILLNFSVAQINQPYFIEAPIERIPNNTKVLVTRPISNAELEQSLLNCGVYPMTHGIVHDYDFYSERYRLSFPDSDVPRSTFTILRDMVVELK